MNSQKNLVQTLKKRLNERYLVMQFIIGPRQVGKTTSAEILTKSLKSDSFLIADGDGVDSKNWLTLIWQQAQIENKLLILDEIQKIPDWSETIKKLWDSGKKNQIKCIFLGSSSLTLQKGLSESLTGRFELLTAYHWSFLDSTLLMKTLTFEDYLIYGGYPGSYKLIKDKSRWIRYHKDSIIETVIGKDILMQTQVKSPGLFRQSFYVLANLPAQVMSYNKILGQLQDKGNVDLIKNYIHLFESAYLIKAIHKYSKNEIRKNQSSPKIIVLAPSLCTFHRLDNLSSEYMGHVFESLVGSQLLKHFDTIYYWAEGDYEVDFVVEYKSKLLAIEVKSGRQKKSISLDRFIKKYPKAQSIFITKQNYPVFEKSPQAFFDQLV